jgi:putative transposase
MGIIQYNGYVDDVHHRHTIRLANYDYSSDGFYFVTICAQEKEFLFGNINDGKMKVNVAGKIIKKYWLKLPEKFKNVQIDISQIMPNHFHGIIVINNEQKHCVNKGHTHRYAPTHDNVVGAHLGVRPDGTTLGDIIRWFKTMTTNEYIKLVKKDV